MQLGFNTFRNNQTSGRVTSAVLVGNLRNTIASTTRKFKFCNSNSPDLNITFNCVFNGLYNPNITQNDTTFSLYHILNHEEIPIEFIENENNNDNQTGNKIMPLTKALNLGPFNPSQIKSVYSIPSLIPLAGIRRPIITIITAFINPYLINDVNKFGKIFGLPKCNLKIYNFSRSFVTQWAIESTIDVQWVYAINPYCEIRLIQAASNKWNDILNAINFANNKNNFNPKIDTDIMTMSFGIPDNGGLTKYNNYFNNPNVIYLAASGDSNNVTFPSSCANVISVGGTTLNLNSNNLRETEKVWSLEGCGYSKSFQKPSYQPATSTFNLKSTPDVCGIADPKTGCYVVINQKIYSVGGTSITSPMYAGMFSLVTQQRLNDKKSTYTSVQNKPNTIQNLLYSTNNNNCFFDVTEGSSGPYSAKTGFDVPSGLGVIICNNLIANLK